MGWSDEAVRATRDYVGRISKIQTDMIDQIMENWKHQLTATTMPMAMPRSFAGQMPGSTMPQFNLRSKIDEGPHTRDIAL
jgi:hypothetical protein